MLLLELKEKYNSMNQEDVTNTSTHTIQYPTTYHETCDFMKNYSNVITIDFGPAQNLRKVGLKLSGNCI